MRETEMSEPTHNAIAPHASAWVGANAGSGKTYILVSRLVRLMLAGVAPEKLLCLTYTRAAAAEMQERLYELLAEWALKSDDGLRHEVQQRLGLAADATQLRRARALFARALETPGGLRVQTIHAFCESLLKRFPLEAGLSPQFDLLDEQDGDDLQRALISALLSDKENHHLADALARLTRALSEADLHALGRQIINRRARLAGDYDARLAQLAELLGFTQKVPQAETLIEECTAPYLGEAKALADWLAEGGKQDQEKAEGLRLWSQYMQDDKPLAGWKALQNTVLTQQGSIRKNLCSKGLAAAQADKAETLQHLAAQVVATGERLNALTSYHMSAALYVFATHLLHNYEREKRRRAVLDYDDLISATNRLLKRAKAAQWVLYKIDRGLTHILVDEAQDTSQDQWQVIRTLADEFFNDASQTDEPRTLFAVGDEKQSIFSFQGADPEAFTAQQNHFEKAVAAYGGSFHYVPLIQSRRSAPQILELVDTVFNTADYCDGVTADGTRMHHIAHRNEAVGHVEIWPLVQSDKDDDEIAVWDVPQQTKQQDGRTRLADQIADKIAALLNDSAQNVTAGDVLILVRKRDGFVEDMTRALKHRQIGVAGADRMVLLDQIVIMDILAAIDVALNPLDDMALAIVLRSPIGGLDEEALFALAHGRKKTLWQALQQAAESQKESAEAAAFQRLLWLLEAVHDTPPYELLAQFLNRQNVHYLLHARLGAEIDDPINELLRLALAYESRHAASVQGFVHWLRQGQQEIKRDMESRGAAVRIMTIHGAKGLEAPIVFLPDTCRPPVKRGGSIDRLQFNAQSLPLWRATKDLLDPYSAAQVARQEALARQEERRLLYVALTRARDRLYIGGWLGKRDKPPPEGSWYDMLLRAFQTDADADDGSDKEPPMPAPQTLEPAAHLAAGEVPLGQDAAQKDADADARLALSVPPPPSWLNRKPPPAQPARYYGDKLFSPSALQPPAPPLENKAAGTALRTAAWRGTIVHKLLERLPMLPPDARAAAAEAFVARAISGQRDVDTPKTPDAIVDEALAILAMPELADLFSPAALAEVPISGVLHMADGQKLALSGQIDRLVERADTVRVVDFKTGNPPEPSGDAAHNPTYVLQMAAYRALLSRLYPAKTISCALVWTENGLLQELDAATLDSALQAILNGEKTLP